jgi:hypothetical protein
LKKTFDFIFQILEWPLLFHPFCRAPLLLHLTVRLIRILYVVGRGGGVVASKVPLFLICWPVWGGKKGTQVIV